MANGFYDEMLDASHDEEYEDGDVSRREFTDLQHQLMLATDELKRLGRSQVMKAIASQQPGTAPLGSHALATVSREALGAFGAAQGAKIAQAFGRDPGRWIRKAGEFGGSSKAMGEGDDTAGGSLVPIEFVPELLRFVAKFGAFRRNVRVIPMKSDYQLWPRRTGGVTSYWLGEGVSITASDMSVANVGLTPKKLGTFVVVSAELEEDSAVELGAVLLEECAMSIAEKEDQAGFNGDGSSTHGNITGVIPSLTGLSGTIANIAGLVVGDTNSKTAWTNLTLATMGTLMARLPEQADNENTKIFCHKRFWGEVLVKLAASAGGVSREEIEGRPRRQFLGYDVETVSVMPRVTAASTVVCLFGDLRQTALMGQRRDIRMDVAREVYFTTDQIAFRCLERVAISVYNIGNASATESEREPGGIVGLITDA